MAATRDPSEDAPYGTESGERANGVGAMTLSQQQRDALNKATREVDSAFELCELLQVAVEAAVEALGLDTGAIYTIDSGALYLGATTPALPSDFPLHLRYALLDDHPHIEECLDTRSVIYLKDARAVHLTPDERAVVNARGLVTLIYVPLIAPERPVGVMILGTQSEPVDFPGDMVRLANAVADQIAESLANASTKPTETD